MFGGIFSALLAGHVLGALYVGSSWPILFSGGRTYIQQTFRKNGRFRGAEDRKGFWQTFDEVLFL